LIPNPIRKVLFSIQRNRVRALLMGGQACVLYGAAEFSRDTDLAILASPANLVRLGRALVDLQAEVIAVPPFEPRYLLKGHAIHFRCRHPEAAGMRVDMMTKMRGVDPFPRLWRRRTTTMLEDGTRCDLLSLPDLVRAKKTQRDKDWPMLRRLLEANYFKHREQPTPPQLRFWMLELRTPELLIELASAKPQLRRWLKEDRALLNFAEPGKEAALADALLKEELAEREVDRRYWAPLKKELEQLRLTRGRKSRG
jgi:hypothetical protein